ncbi:unnamed protein product [Ambrosiozyma monospora]|uniref:Unnamed protein product n=1 Tax=Ambrosiozyma monospora TaxID=43982 RepID=A0ACB5T2W2_AMBMO|nr:unnamed protein product [Ambrosiozyma monospora]
MVKVMGSQMISPSSGEAEKTPADKSDMEIDKETNDEATEKTSEEPKDKTVNEGETQLDKPSDEAEKESGAKSTDEEATKANENYAMDVDKDPSNENNDDVPMAETVDKEQNDKSGTEGDKVLNDQSCKDPMDESVEKFDEPNSKSGEVDDVSNDLSAKKTGDETVDQSVDKGSEPTVDSVMEVVNDLNAEASEKVVDKRMDDVNHNDAEPKANSEMEFDEALNAEYGQKVTDTPMDEAGQNGDKDSTDMVSDEVVNVVSNDEGSKEPDEGTIEKGEETIQGTVAKVDEPNAGENKSGDESKQQPSDESGAKEDKGPTDEAGVEKNSTATDSNEAVGDPAVVELPKESSLVSEEQAKAKTTDEETPTTEKSVEETAEPNQSSPPVVNQDTSAKSLATPEQEDVEMTDAPDLAGSKTNGGSSVQDDSLAVIAKAAIENETQASSAIDGKGFDSVTGDAAVASGAPSESSANSKTVEGDKSDKQGETSKSTGEEQLVEQKLQIRMKIKNHHPRPKNNNNTNNNKPKIQQPNKQNPNPGTSSHHAT